MAKNDKLTHPSARAHDGWFFIVTTTDGASQIACDHDDLAAVTTRWLQSLAAEKPSALIFSGASEEVEDEDDDGNPVQDKNGKTKLIIEGPEYGAAFLASRIAFIRYRNLQDMEAMAAASAAMNDDGEDDDDEDPEGNPKITPAGEQEQEEIPDLQDAAPAFQPLDG